VATPEFGAGYKRRYNFGAEDIGRYTSLVPQ
jgi:hypothetical protein